MKAELSISEIEDHENTLNDVFCDIENGIWQADLHFQRGATGLGNEYLTAAKAEFERYNDVLRVYLGSEFTARLRASLETNANSKRKLIAHDACLVLPGLT